VKGTPGGRPAFKRAAEHVFFGVGGGIASTVYGTIVVMATLTAAYATETHPWKLAGIVLSAALVLWIAHLYAHGLSESIVQERHLSRDELSAIVRRELGIPLAAAAPTAALVLGAIGLFGETTAVWLALAVGLVTLTAEGVRFARLEGFGLVGTVVAMGLNLALGLLVVAMKVALAH
jgi:hypothetical protein